MTRKQLVMMAILAWAAIPAVAQDSEHTYAEWSSETRAALVFKVNAEAVRGVLPTGWSLVSSDDSADQTNLTVIFIDRHLVLDAQGQAVGSGSNRYMVMSVPAHNDV